MRKIVVNLIFLTAVLVVINACQSQGDVELSQYVANGKDIYLARCKNCHGANGEGLGELAPPLTDTIFMKVNKQKIACYIKNGADEPMVVNGKTYHEKMPGFKDLHTIDIAQVTVYITNTFGNKQGMYTQREVADDLANCK